MTPRRAILLGLALAVTHWTGFYLGATAHPPKAVEVFRAVPSEAPTPAPATTPSGVMYRRLPCSHSGPGTREFGVWEEIGTEDATLGMDERCRRAVKRQFRRTTPDPHADLDRAYRRTLQNAGLTARTSHEAAR